MMKRIFFTLLFLLFISCIREKNINSPFMPSDNVRGNDLCPQFSPDGGTLYFYSYTNLIDTEIFKIQIDGHYPLQLTDDSNNDSPFFDLSPDGSTLVCWTNVEDQSGIWIMNSDGSNKRDLQCKGINPRISPDGTQILYMKYILGVQYKVFTMDIDGQNQLQLTNGPFSDNFPQYSPDGTQICFSSYRSGNSEIYVMNSDGSNMVQLTDDSTDYESPFFSRGGSKITFSGSRPGINNFSVCIMDNDGSHLIEIDRGFPGQDSDSFSPDGSKFLYTKLYEGLAGQIYIADIDGSNKQNLTPEFSDSRFPTFTPDGSQIAFCTWGSDHYLRIAVMDSDGSNKRILTDYNF